MKSAFGIEGLWDSSTYICDFMSGKKEEETAAIQHI